MQGTKRALLAIGAMLLTTPAFGQQSTLVPMSPAEIRNNLVCFVTFAALGGQATDAQTRTATTALIGHFHGRLSRSLTVEQIMDQVRTLSAEGAFTTNQAAETQRCRAEALQVGNDMVAIGRAMVDAESRNGSGRP